MDPLTRLLMQGAAGAAGAGLGIEEIFSTWLYTGNGSTQTITNGIDLSGEGGLVWVKGRSGATGHRLVDTSRGGQNSLQTNSTAAQAYERDGISDFSSSGFFLGTFLGSDTNYNANGSTYASWTFRKAPGFFDVVTYTGTGVARTVAHNLGSVPGTIIVKRTDTTGDWQVYHRSIANTEYLVLNSTAAKATGTTRWNSTTPTSTVFSLGTDATVNASGGTYVAYLFAHDEQIFGESGDQSVIKCGSYTGNGSLTGPIVNLGWEPQWLLIKQSSFSGENWFMYDTMRGIPTGGDDARLYPNLSNAELIGADDLSVTSTGFQITTNGTGHNQNGATYIYIAIRRGPMKTPTSGTEVLSLEAVTPSAGQVFTTGFPVDATFSGYRSSVSNRYIVQDRIRGYALNNVSGNYANLATSSTIDESVFNPNTPFIYAADSNNSVRYGQQIASISNVVYAFRRAPGFFDVVAYTGTGVARTVSHNLGVAPELMIVKRRNSQGSWPVYNSTLTVSGVLFLDLTDSAYATGNIFWSTSSPTSSVFSVNTAVTTNASGDTYIAYLFATLPGVSKVGSYTGTGNTQQIDCGFTSGARFVLVKRTDSTGDWYVWDTARGITSANDPYLLINSTAAEVTTTDYIDPYAAGFEISSTAPAAINASGGNFVFLAIA